MSSPGCVPSPLQRGVEWGSWGVVVMVGVVVCVCWNGKPRALWAQGLASWRLMLSPVILWILDGPRRRKAELGTMPFSPGNERLLLSVAWPWALGPHPAARGFLRGRPVSVSNQGGVAQGRAFA